MSFVGEIQESMSNFELPIAGIADDEDFPRRPQRLQFEIGPRLTQADFALFVIPQLPMRKPGLRIGLESANDKVSVFNDFIRRMLLLAAGRIRFRQMRQDLYLVLLIAVLSFVAR